MNHDPVIQRQHTPKESHQQPQDGCLAEMGAEGTEEHLCAALIIRPERCQGGNHGGGGSADGAAVITALDRLYETHLKPQQLQEIGLTVGADIPFCITGGMAMAEGIGEILTPIPGRLDAQLVICKPPVGVSTAAAYRKFDEAGAVCPPLTESLVAALIAGDLKGASDCMSNAFEKLLSLPEVDRIERGMQEHGALTAVMSGSGSAVYGIFDSRLKAEKCLLSLKEEYREVFLCEPYPAGCTASKNFFGGETE